MAINTIIIVGDLFPFASNLHLFIEGDVQTLFGSKICELFAKADYRICNLEGTLTDGDERVRKTGPIITAPTQAINAYKALGVDYCMLANNHITDGGTQGVKETIETLDKVGIGHIGAGMNDTAIPHYTILAIAEKNLCIYNVCETMYNKPRVDQAGAWLYDEYLVCKELELLKRKCDHIIVIYHGGIEKFQYPSPETRKRFHRMADSGADIVLSQHTHCIGCEEHYNESYLLYGQGDFLFNNFRPEITSTGLILEIEIDTNGLKVNKYKSRIVDFMVHLDEEQDLKGFIDRSRLLLKDEDEVFRLFQEFCMKELHLYLNAYKRPSFPQRVIKKLFPSYYNQWRNHKLYNDRDLLFSLHTLRSEQNRETAVVGIEKYMGISR